MTFKQLETQILRDLKIAANNNKIKMKDIMEWSTGPITPQDNETLFRLDHLGVNVCVILPDNKKAMK